MVSIEDDVLNTIGNVYWFKPTDYDNGFMLVRFARAHVGDTINSHEIEGPYIILTGPSKTRLESTGVIDLRFNDPEVRLATREECNTDAVKQLLLSTIK